MIALGFGFFFISTPHTRTHPNCNEAKHLDNLLVYWLQHLQMNPN
jgi:hypothetical protein